MRKLLLLPAVILLTLSFFLPAMAENTEIVITFTGDCTLGADTKMMDSPYSFLAYIEKYGVGYPFEKVRSIFEKDDLTIINLEGVFSDSTKGIVDKTYHFRAPKEYADILTASSVEAASLGNNHTQDFGDWGCLETIDALESRGIDWFGVNLPINPSQTPTDDISKTYIYEKNGVRIGFVAAYISTWWADKSDYHKNQVLSLKEAGCDLIIACLHGGVEYDAFHDDNQSSFAHRFQSYGCDIVIGHHPHVLQGMELNENGTIVYSLGNFCFGGNQVIKKTDHSDSRYSVIYQFTFLFDDDSQYLGYDLTIYPCVAATEIDGRSNYQPSLAAGKDAEKVMSLILKDTQPRKALNTELSEDGGAVQAFVPAPSRSK